MDLPDEDDDTNYNAVARFFHWAIAFLIIGMLALGLTMGSVNYGVPRHEVYDFHKSIGLLILLLAIGRIIWRFASVPPEALDTHAPWERALAKAAHSFLYLTLFAMPLSGWLMSSAAGRPPTFFGLPVPRLLEKNESLAGVMGGVHQFLAYGLMIVIALHVAGALKHHLIDKDATLRRMAGQRLQWLKTVFVVLLIDLVLSAAAFLFLKDTVMEKISAAQGTEQAMTQAQPAETADIASLGAHEWLIDASAATLAFETQVMGGAFTGRFNSFSGKILFNPDDLSEAGVDIVIDMNDVSTGDQSRDDALRQSDWFSTVQFPRARYVAHQIEKMDGNQYVAIGHLTIRDTIMPLTLPFTLDITEEAGVRKAHMLSTVTLNRLDFGVGQGEWQSTEAVPDEVTVNIDLTAQQPR